MGGKQSSKALIEAENVEVTVFDGPCPAGNVGVQVNHLAPVNKGEVVWTIEPTAVIFFGRLFNSGHVDLRRTIAFAEVKLENLHMLICLLDKNFPHYLATVLLTAEV